MTCIEIFSSASGKGHYELLEDLDSSDLWEIRVRRMEGVKWPWTFFSCVQFTKNGNGEPIKIFKKPLKVSINT